MQFQEPLAELFTSTQLLVLNFNNIPASTPADESIQSYFELAERSGQNPRLPENRQAFNDRLLQKTAKRYLLSAYGEDRASMLAGSSIASDGRTIHLGIDIFSVKQEVLYAPCDGIIVRVGQEAEDHSFGNFLILQPDEDANVFVFFGHLSAGSSIGVGSHVVTGQPIGLTGDYVNGENGGWSRHLHLQVLAKLPSENTAPIGYASPADFSTVCKQFPDPMQYFPNWKVH